MLLQVSGQFLLNEPTLLDGFFRLNQLGAVRQVEQRAVVALCNEIIESAHSQSLINEKRLGFLRKLSINHLFQPHITVNLDKLSSK